MKKRTVILIFTAVALIITGAAVFAGAAVLAGGKVLSSFDGKATEKTFTANGEFDGISVDVQTEDVCFALSSDGACRVVCAERQKVKHTVSVEDGQLKIGVNDTRKWYDYIYSVFSFKKESKIKVYLPVKSFSTLTVKASAADISVPEEFTFGSAKLNLSTGDVDFAAKVKGRLEIKVSTGDTVLYGVSAGETDLTATTGDITLKDTKCAGKINIETDTGDVSFDNSDGEEITVKTTTGDVTGSLLSSKVFITETSTGDIKVPKSATGGKCKITTSTGDIIIKTIN